MQINSFNQPPPQLENQFDDDRVLRSYLKRQLPAEWHDEIAKTLHEMGELAAGELYEMQLADRLNEPVLTQWDAWGNRIDHIEITPLWKRAEQIAASHGVVAAAYDGNYGRFNRIHQFALAYLFHPSTDVYMCPLAMTDGAARTLMVSGNQALIDKAVPRLTSRDPQKFWTSGQWMTESTGGSDVGLSETVAKEEADGSWRLYGRKWFTSAATSQMTLTLARPDGNGPGGKGLAMFYLEPRDESGRLQNIEILRLKDKLGTKKVPTAELILNGVTAVPVNGLANGVRNIVPMLKITRTWNSISSVAFMRRGLALARDFAKRRHAFGSTLDKKTLHVDTMAGLQAEFEAAFHLTFYLVELIGRDEANEISEDQQELLRILTSICKLTTGRQAVHIASEVLELFGGAGYVEDTGLPMLLRDSQVLPIWEGTTNVLSLDTLRAMHDSDALAILYETIKKLITVDDPTLSAMGSLAETAVKECAQWLDEAFDQGRANVEAGARRFALTLGRALSLALLVNHAQWSMAHEQDGRARAAAIRFAIHGVNLLHGYDLEYDDALANERPLKI
ncbi:MAG: acyl-CoA dehydrogenase family protein [Chloroflexota bacterium]